MNAQQDPEKVQAAISVIEAKLVQIKRTIEELLLSLELQNKVYWPDIFDKYVSLAHDLSRLQARIQQSAVPQGEDNDGLLFRTHLVVPQQITLEIDPALKTGTEGRVSSWTHEVVPEALRTKLGLLLELTNNPEAIDAELSTLDFEQMVKKVWIPHLQTKTLNQEMDSIMKELESIIKEPWELVRKSTEAEKRAGPDPETVDMVMTIMTGRGIISTEIHRTTSTLLGQHKTRT